MDPIGLATSLQFQVYIQLSGNVRLAEFISDSETPMLSLPWWDSKELLTLN